MTEDVAIEQLCISTIFLNEKGATKFLHYVFSYSRNRNHLTFQNSLVNNDAIHRYYAGIGGVVAFVWNY